MSVNQLKKKKQKQIAIYLDMTWHVKSCWAQGTTHEIFLKKNVKLLCFSQTKDRILYSYFPIVLRVVINCSKMTNIILVV